MLSILNKSGYNIKKIVKIMKISVKLYVDLYFTNETCILKAPPEENNELPKEPNKIWDFIKQRIW